jgi:hypothetical protein
LLTKEQRARLEWVANWEYSKSAVDLDPNADLDDVVEVACGLAESESMKAAEEWLVDYFVAYENLPGILDQWNEQVAKEIAAEHAQITNVVTLGSNQAAQKARNLTLLSRTPSSALVDEVQRLRRVYPHLDPTLEEFRRPDSVFQRLPDAQLQTMERMLTGYPVREWHVIRVGASAVRMPFRLHNFELRLGPEITRDWLIARPGHGKPIKDIAASWAGIRKFAEYSKPQIEADGKHRFALRHVRMITDAGETTVITYFEDAVGV